MLSYSISSLVLYSAQGVEGAYSFPYIREGNVKLQHFLGSRTLFGALRVRGKERAVLLTSGEEMLSYSISSLVLYSAQGAEGAYSFPYIRGGNVKLQHFPSRTLLGKQYVKRVHNRGSQIPLSRRFFF